MRGARFLYYYYVRVIIQGEKMSITASERVIIISLSYYLKRGKSKPLRPGSIALCQKLYNRVRSLCCGFYCPSRFLSWQRYARFLHCTHAFFFVENSSKRPEHLFFSSTLWHGADARVCNGRRHVCEYATMMNDTSGLKVCASGKTADEAPRWITLMTQHNGLLILGARHIFWPQNKRRISVTISATVRFLLRDQWH